MNPLWRLVVGSISPEADASDDGTDESLRILCELNLLPGRSWMPRPSPGPDSGGDGCVDRIVLPSRRRDASLKEGLLGVEAYCLMLQCRNWKATFTVGEFGESS